MNELDGRQIHILTTIEKDHRFAFGATAPIASVTGVGAFFLAQLYVQPILVTANVLSALGTGATIVSETKAGIKILKQDIYLILNGKVTFSLLVVSQWRSIASVVIQPGALFF